MNGYVFFIAFAGFMGGTAFRSFFDFGYGLGIVFLILAGVSAFFTVREKPILFFAPIFLCAVGIGILRYDIGDIFGKRSAGTFTEGEVTGLRALIVDEVIEKEKSTQLTVRFFFEEKLLSPKALITTDMFPRYNYGDEIIISGTLAKPANFMTESGREFDYAAYLRKDGIYYIARFPSIELISHGNGSLIKSILFSLKKKFLTNVSILMPQPHASLMGGLVLGTDESLPPDLEGDFRRVGLIHIVVLSGYNISIVAEAVMRLFAFASRKIALFFGGTAIVLFALMTGGHAAVVRASIMALLILLSHATGRRYDIVRALFLAAGAMVFVNPRILVFDMSFQLSFLATFALIIVAPHFEKIFRSIPNILNVRESLVATLSTQIFVLPVLLYAMGQVSLISIIANVVVLPFIPVSMLVGFLASFIMFFSHFLALPFAWFGAALLSYVIGTVRFFSKIPFAAFSVPLLPFWGVVLVYVFYAGMLVHFRKIQNSWRGSE